MSEILPFGEAALQVSLGEAADPATLPLVHALARRVAAGRLSGDVWGAPVPGMSTLLVPFDPHSWSDAEARDRLGRLVVDLADDPTPPPPQTHHIPVRYGGAHGPDLPEVAERLGLAPERVVQLHASVVYRVAILGFMPGFAYLGELPQPLRLPRRDTPRTRVPAGSVAIAGRQTAIYPAATPGGWHLIGRTDVLLWDIDHDPPATLGPGDRVRFEPVD